jgi:hypothetical protein
MYSLDRGNVVRDCSQRPVGSTSMDPSPLYIYLHQLATPPLQPPLPPQRPFFRGIPMSDVVLSSYQFLIVGYFRHPRLSFSENGGLHSICSPRVVLLESDCSHDHSIYQSIQLPESHLPLPHPSNSSHHAFEKVQTPSRPLVSCSRVHLLSYP